MKPVKFDDYKNRYEYLTMKREDGILELRIHGRGTPDKPVLWGIEPHDELSHCFNDIARDYDNECVIFTGTGDDFIGEEMNTGGTHGRFAIPPLKWDPIHQNGKYLETNLLSIEVPMIAAVNGPALVHAELAVLCDIVICSDNASFQDAPHFPEGNVPGDSVQFVWPHLLGINRGRYFLLTGQKIPAPDALKLGIVNEVLPRNQLMPRAYELAREICKRPKLVRRYARVAMTQVLKKMVMNELGYGLVMEGLAAAQAANEYNKK